ncbi:MAG TPA: alpha/beta fold hydrolase [Candidatus Polarisedimenticolaceae bacterium]|nr:alpha/beta fold hydrolase [Candidatus Polarisedimenticolaceae bacterium]
MSRIVSKRFLLALLLAGVAAAAGVVLIEGNTLAGPSQREIGSAPPSLHAETVSFPSKSGATLKGWLAPGTPGKGAVLLMHGIHADRTSMLPRALFLSKAGYGVLLFDFQANGESIGARQTFGHLESLDARSALEYLRSRLPNERVGVIGTSLGGAAALVGPEPLDVQAMVLEAVYPTIEEATANRIAIRLGLTAARLAAPVLLSQLRFRTGATADELRPIDRIASVRAPVFVIAGGADLYTTAAESRRLFQAAHEPKEYWELAGAGHQDFHAFARAEYERRVLEFLQRNLRDGAGAP